MKALSLLVLGSWIVFTSCHKPDPTDFRDEWIGEYAGTSYHWIERPVDTVIVSSKTERSVHVAVQKGHADSTLSLTITYSDTLTHFENNLKFSATGRHFDQWGGGSSYGSLTVQFDPDSLHYKYRQNCGIPCSSGIYFDIKQK